MDWIKLIIGLIVVMIWIANNLRSKEKPPPLPPPLPPIVPDESRRERGADELQEFLKKLRQQAETEGSPRPAPAAPAAPSPAVVVEPPRRPVEPKRPPKKKPQADTAPNLAHRTAAVTSLVGEELTRESLMGSQAAAFVSRRPATASVRDALAVLRSPNGLGTALVLREILGEPVSRRRRASRKN